MEDLLKKEIENYIQIYANTFTPQIQVVFLFNYEWMTIKNNKFGIDKVSYRADFQCHKKTDT